MKKRTAISIIFALLFLLTACQSKDLSIGVPQQAKPFEIEDSAKENTSTESNDATDVTPNSEGSEQKAPSKAEDAASKENETDGNTSETDEQKTEVTTQNALNLRPPRYQTQFPDADKNSVTEWSDPYKQLTAPNGDVLTYYNTNKYNPDYPVDLYLDKQQSTYRYCRCGMPLQYISATPCDFYTGGITPEEAIEIAKDFLSQHFGDYFKTMEFHEWSYDNSSYGQIWLSFKQYVGGDDGALLRGIICEIGRDGIPITYRLARHDHKTEAIPLDDLKDIKKEKIEAYTQNLIDTDPNKRFQNVDKAEIMSSHRIIYKDNQPTLETVIQASVGYEIYYCELSKFK